jgi:hypothetical protein
VAVPAAIVGSVVGALVTYLLPKLWDALRKGAPRLRAAAKLTYLRTVGGAIFLGGGAQAVSLTYSGHSHELMTYLGWYLGAAIGLAIVILTTLVIDKVIVPRQPKARPASVQIPRGRLPSASPSSSGAVAASGMTPERQRAETEKAKRAIARDHQQRREGGANHFGEQITSETMRMLRHQQPSPETLTEEEPEPIVSEVGQRAQRQVVDSIVRSHDPMLRPSSAQKKRGEVADSEPDAKPELDTKFRKWLEHEHERGNEYVKQVQRERGKLLEPAPLMATALSAFRFGGHMTLAGLTSQAQEWSTSLRQRIARENLARYADLFAGAPPPADPKPTEGDFGRLVEYLNECLGTIETVLRECS